MYGVYVCVCSYRCALLARRVSLRGSSTDGNPFVWVCHVLYYFPIETRETFHRSPICRGVHMYVSTHVHTWVHLHACVWVGLGKLYGLRGSTDVKKGYRIDIVKWMCATRDWVCVRTWENNLLMTSSVRLVNDTNQLRASGPCELYYLEFRLTQHTN